MKNKFTRRNFLQKGAAAGIGLATVGAAQQALASPSKVQNVDMGGGQGMKLGLVTYNWGKDWDLPTLIKNCEASGILGLELRTEHAHKVETNLSAAKRADVKKRFDDSAVTCLGYGSNFDFHHADQKEVKENIAGAKEYIKLCSDIGATGIKVKPNGLPGEVAKEKTIAQIAKSFNEIGKYAQDYGQLIRVEVHGKLTQQLPNMKAIFDQVTEPNVRVCWNCNDTDTMDPGLEHNFNSVRKWFGDTVHIRELNVGNYPYQDMMDLFVGIKYDGWLLLEARTEPADRVGALKEQLAIFNRMIANSEKGNRFFK